MADPATTRQAIAGAIEALIVVLDAMEPDPDLEPSLGWTKTLATGGTDDLEDAA